MSPTAWQRVVSALSTTATAYTVATEVAGVTIQVNDVSPDAPVHLFGILVVTTGVGATTGTPRIRRGGVAGTLVGAAPAISNAASSTVVLVNAADDFPGEVATQTYTLSLTAAGIASTGVLAYLMAVIG